MKGDELRDCELACQTQLALHQPRVPAQTRAAAERICDFDEISGLFDEKTAREQASRCIDCPEPACVQGMPA